MRSGTQASFTAQSMVAPASPTRQYTCSLKERAQVRDFAFRALR